MHQQNGLRQHIREATRLFRFGLPLVIGQAAAVGMGLTDVFMAGQASPADLAGVTLGNSISIFMFLVLGGILFANSPMIGFHFGAGDKPALRNQFHQCFWLALPLGVFAMLLMGGGLILVGHLGAEPEVATIARNYLTPMIATVFCYHLLFWMRTSLEAVNVTSAVMVVNIGGLLLNLILDYALVHGELGMPRLGGAGCGWATLTVVSSQAFTYYLWLKNGRTTRKLELFAQISRPQLKAIREIVRLGLPIATTTLFEFSFFGVIPLVVASLGATVVSGHSIAQQFDALMFIVPLGIGQALTIAISHHYGGKQYHKARRSCWAGLGLTAVIALVQVAVYLLFPEFIAAFFSDDRQVQSIAIELMLFAAAYRFMDAMAVAGISALRGYKVTKAPMYIQFVAFWLAGFPLAYSLAMTDFWGPAMGVSGFWLGAVVALSISALLLNWMVWRHSKRPLLTQ